MEWLSNAWLEGAEEVKKRNWDARTKAGIVLKGLTTKPVSAVCAENDISQAQYYRWRGQFLANMYLAFEGDIRRTAIVSRENIRLKKIIGELTSELRKASLARENIHLKKTIGNLAMELRKTGKSRPAAGQ